MALFKYITRGEQNVQGKQKAYFCAHPDDYGIYFEKVSNEILNTLEKENNRNCAFFYLEDANAERDDEFKFSFKEMNLIIMPVTTKLLTTANFALDIEFKLAIENHIPILPIMMESGLENIFNAKCGDIQFLDPYARDATAILYEEKLTKYLTSILIGDELAEKIRNAFDAYIFLSYRKKDRKYAQELMRLIHKNDFCRDIAIWYDEFLTPGENFNKSIEDALNKSKLFALSVTPSLLEKGKDKYGNECENYIVTTEYPMAKKRAEKDENFSILPAEIVQTNKEILSNKYKGIPECVNAKDAHVLTKSLANALKGIALRESNTDPEHVFFIGLAYLGGVDVEKDVERGVKLLISAAEDGVPGAMGRLAFAYRDGEIGRRDYTEAIKWQRRLSEHVKTLYDNKQDEESAAEYLVELSILGDFIFESRCYDDAEAHYKTLLAESQRIAEKFLKNWMFYIVSVSYERLGDVYSKRGNDTKSEECYCNSFDIRKNIVNIANTIQARTDLSVCYVKLGTVRLNRNDFEGAWKCFDNARGILEGALSESDSDEAWHVLIKNYERQGYVCESCADLEKAEEYYLKALNLSENLLCRSSSELTDDFVMNCERMGKVCELRGDNSDAEKYYGKGVSASARLVVNNLSLEARRNLALCNYGLGRVCSMKMDFPAAGDSFYKAMEITEEIVKETELDRDMSSLAVCYTKVGYMYAICEAFAEADEFFLKALDIAKKITDEMVAVEQYVNVAGAYYRMSLLAPHKIFKAECLERSLELWNLIAERVVDNLEYMKERDLVKSDLRKMPCARALARLKKIKMI